MPPPSDSRPPEGIPAPGASGRLAEYRIVRELGRGGQGIVYLAEDPRHRKLVALKVLKDGALSAESIGRLRREVEAAARLNHPGICGVHEAVLDGSSPFIAMNFIEGQTLAQAIARAQQPNDQTWVVKAGTHAETGDAAPADAAQPMPSGPSTRHDILRLVRIVEKAARALHVAHEARVIHRDIKPGNIMITPEGDPVILDFGLAQFEDTGLAALTRTGEIWGTPAYLSPEQLMGTAVKLDRRTDVWSLGVTLYECLTLRRPFEGPTSNQIFHAIQSREPADPCRVNRALPADIRVVLDTALEKDRERRYETALALAEDLRALCEDRPIAARPIGPITRFTRWARRNPGVAASLLTTFGVLVAGIVVATVLVLELNKSLGETKRALADRDRQSFEKDRALVQSKGLRLLAESSASLASDPGLALLLALEGAALARDKPVLANGAANDALAELREVRTLGGNHATLDSAEFSPDGARVVTTSEDGDVRTWDVATGEVLASQFHPRVIRASFTPRGACVVTLSGAGDAAARIWDAATWTELARLGEPDVEDGHGVSRPSAANGGPADELLRGRISGVVAVNLSPDAGRIVVVRGREASVWDAESGRRITTLARPLEAVTSIGFSPDGRRILTFAATGLELWDADSGRALASAPPAVADVRLTRFSPDGGTILALSIDRGHLWVPATGRVTQLGEAGSSIDSLSFSRDGRQILAITNKTIRIWDAETGKARDLCGPDPTPGAPPPQAEFTRDGMRVIGASCDGTAHVWDTHSGEDLRAMTGQAGDTRFVRVSPYGSLVLTASSKGTATLWDSEADKWIQLATLRGHAGEILGASFSQDGSFVVTASADRTARVWHARTGVGAPLLERHEGPVDVLGFSADGRLGLTGSSDGTPRVWSVAEGRMVARLAVMKRTHSEPQISPDGARVLALCDDGSATVFATATGEPTATLRGGASFCHICFSPDGARIAAASEEEAYVFDAPKGTRIAAMTGHEGAITFLGFCGGGARVVTASADRTVRLWDAKTGEEIARLPSHAARLPALSEDGLRIAVVSTEGEAAVCDASTGKVVVKLPGSRHAGPRFSLDGRRLATESSDGTFRIWDAASGAEITLFPRDEGDLLHAFSPDGRTVLTSAKDGVTSLWDATSGKAVLPLRGRGSPVRHAGFSPDGRLIVVSTSDETRVLDASTAAELWVVPLRHGGIRTVRFSPDGNWLAAGYAGGVTRLWPANPIAKAREVAPRALTLAEIQAHEVDDDDARGAVRSLFDDYFTNEELAATLERRDGLSDRLRAAAISAAGLRDRRMVAERLCRRSWADVLRPSLAPESYAMALRRVQIALRLFSGVDLGRTTLGAAQFRAGLASTALATLEQAASGRPHAPTSIFIALAHARLGQRAEARTAIAGARRILEASGARYPEEIRRLLEEADDAIKSESRPR